MPSRVKEGVVPPKPGWAYPTENPIAWGYNYESLLKELINYRLGNGITLGDPEADLANDICLRSASICSPLQLSDEASLEKAERDATSSQRDQVILWNKYLTHYKSTGKYKALESKEVATARGNTCAACPQNRKITELNCTPCIAEMDRQSIMFSMGQKVNEPLGYCASALHDNRTAVWLPKEGLERSLAKVEDTPDFCWLRGL